MKSSRTQNFRQQFQQLPSRIQETAKKNYQIWKQNPFHPSLEFKIVKPKENIWSVRIGIGSRALGVMRTDENKIVWFWVGSHSEYDRILAKK
jgi:mRNA-degrading endonuclease RelE of RelBE toxin-antitoxin system